MFRALEVAWMQLYVKCNSYRLSPKPPVSSPPSLGDRQSGHFLSCRYYTVTCHFLPAVSKLTENSSVAVTVNFLFPSFILLLYSCTPVSLHSWNFAIRWIQLLPDKPPKQYIRRTIISRNRSTPPAWISKQQD